MHQIAAFIIMIAVFVVPAAIVVVVVVIMCPLAATLQAAAPHYQIKQTNVSRIAVCTGFAAIDRGTSSRYLASVGIEADAGDPDGCP